MVPIPRIILSNKKTSTQRLANYHKEALGTTEIHPFNINNNVKYHKVISYFNEILLPASCTKGLFIERTTNSGGIYEGIKNEFAFVKNGILISFDNYNNLKGLLSSHNWHFNRLFIYSTAGKTSKFIAKQAPSNRYIPNHPDRMLQLVE